MNWTEFIKFLASGYLLYYGVLVVLDLLKPQKGIFIRGDEDLLEFPEETQTTIIEEEVVKNDISSPASKARMRKVSNGNSMGKMSMYPQEE